MHQNNRELSNQIDLHTEEVDAIINDVPGWGNRWGIILAVGVFLTFFVLAHFIRYPDIVRAKVTITTSPPPAILHSRSTGRMNIVASENDLVEAGQVIAYVESNGNWKDVVALEALVNNHSNLSRHHDSLNVGDLESIYSQYKRVMNDYVVFTTQSVQPKQIRMVEASLLAHIQLGNSINAQIDLMRRQLKIAKNKFARDSALFTQQVLSVQDFENSRGEFLVQERNFQMVLSSVLSNRIQTINLERTIAELKSAFVNDSIRLQTEVTNVRHELLAQCEKWKQAYLFISPMAGKVVYLGFIEDNKFVEQGKGIFSIIPLHSKIYGQAQLPVTGSGKVKEGQAVNIRLENYPYHQYGMLEGRLAAMSPLPLDGNYLLRITVPQDLRTTHKSELPFMQELAGETDIITEDLTLLERIFYNFRKLLRTQ